MMSGLLSKLPLRTFRYRLIVGVVVVFSAMMVALFYDLTARQRATMLERQVDEARAMSMALATSASGWIAAEDVSGLQELVEAQLRYPEVLFAIVADHDGRVLAATDRSRRGLYLQDLPQPPRQVVLSRTPDLVDVAAPATIAGNHVGWIRVGIGQQAAERELAAIIRADVVYALLAVVLGSMVVWLIGTLITRRLNVVERTMAAVQSGDRGARASVSGHDEVAAIARAFNSMLDALDLRDADLRASEARYRALIREVQVAIVRCDSGGVILDCNPMAEKIFGVEAGALVGMNVDAPRWRYVAEDGTPVATGDTPISRVRASRQAVRNQMLGVCGRDEEEPIWVLVSAEPEFEVSGAIRQIVVSLVDVSDRRRAGEALREKEETLRAIADSAQDAVLMIDGSGCIALWNPAAARIFGYTADDALGQALHPLLAPQRYIAQYETAFEAFRHSGQGNAVGRTLELAAIRKGGDEFPMELSLSAVKLRGAWRAVGIARDITERKRVEARILRSERSLAEAQRMAHLGSWELDLSSRALTWSDEIFRIFEIDPARFDASYDGFLAAIHPDDREFVDQAYSTSVRTREPYDITHRLLMPDGRIKYVNERCETFYADDGTPLRSVGTVHDITALKLGEMALQRANRALRTLSACNAALVHAESETELLDSICRLIVEAGGYRMAWVGYAQHDPGRTIKPVAQFGHEAGFLAEAAYSWADDESGRGPVGEAIRSGAVQITQDIRSFPDNTPWRDAALKRGYQANIALPLKLGDRTIGVLTIDAPEANAFDDQEVPLLEELAADLSFGIETIRTRVERDRIAQAHRAHEAQLRKSLEQSIGAIADTVEARDPYTAGHQRSVSSLAVAIAQNLGLDGERIHGLQLAATVHDLGKIRIPADILAKPGRLSDVERLLIQTHPESGYEILRGIEFPWPIAEIVRQHHEKPDGSGYPRGLKGDQILLEARILSVADVVEAMTAHRPYRPSLGIEAALSEIEQGRGTRYDTRVADVCLRLFREQGYRIESPLPTP
ncbi:MAG: PAS domain S-box protein [Nevskiales bacterium]|nr:PAS domain S-box protein [Nevskiales bacterium]